MEKVEQNISHNLLDKYASKNRMTLFEVFNMAYKFETGIICRTGQVVDDFSFFSKTKIVPYYVRAFLNELEMERVPFSENDYRV